MLDKCFGLLFYLKKPKNYKKGAVPIYLRITVDGIPKELPTKRTCDPNRWNPASERAAGTKEHVRALNAYLDTPQSKAYEAKRQFEHFENDHTLLPGQSVFGFLLMTDINRVHDKLHGCSHYSCQPVVGTQPAATDCRGGCPHPPPTISAICHAPHQSIFL